MKVILLCILVIAATPGIFALIFPVGLAVAGHLTSKIQFSEEEKLLNDMMADTSEDEETKALWISCEDVINDLINETPLFSINSCIFEVPAFIRSVNPSCYTPKLISLGPLHYGDENLQPMEIYKVRYLMTLFQRYRGVLLPDLIGCLRALEEKAREFYDSNKLANFTNEQFVKLMLLDGCFIIMFLILSKTGTYEKEPILFPRSVARKINSDMVLLENQIPYFVLEGLYNCIKDKLPTTMSFDELVDGHFKMLQSLQVHHRRRSDYPVKHFVDYILKGISASLSDQSPQHSPSHANQSPQQHILHVNSPPRANQTSPSQLMFEIKNATELLLSGITFSRSSKPCFLDIEFQNGVIQIPRLTLAYDTVEIFRNLIVMEQYDHDRGESESSSSSSLPLSQKSGGRTNYITDYMELMDNLINTPADLALLRSCGIIENKLGSDVEAGDKEAARFFNDVVKDVAVRAKKSHYYERLVNVDAYYQKYGPCNRLWNSSKAKLREDYFNSPWAVISLIAAIILLGCTLLQTICLFVE